MIDDGATRARRTRDPESIDRGFYLANCRYDVEVEIGVRLKAEYSKTGLTHFGPGTNEIRVPAT